MIESQHIKTNFNGRDNFNDGFTETYPATTEYVLQSFLETYSAFVMNDRVGIPVFITQTIMSIEE